MREWQQTKFKNLVMPDAVYYQSIWAVRDLYRMEDQIKLIDQDINMGDVISTGIVSEDTNAYNVSNPTEDIIVQKSTLERRVKAIREALETVPLAYRQFILDNYLPDVSGADIITGYRADDSFFSFARAFLSNTLSYTQLEQVLHYGDLGIQYVLMSREAFERIEFASSEPVDGRIYYPARIQRDKQAREDYRKLVKKLDRNGLYLSRIMQEGTGNERL